MARGSQQLNMSDASHSAPAQKSMTQPCGSLFNTWSDPQSMLLQDAALRQQVPSSDSSHAAPAQNASAGTSTRILPGDTHENPSQLALQQDVASEEAQVSPAQKADETWSPGHTNSSHFSRGTQQASSFPEESGQPPEVVQSAESKLALGTCVSGQVE
jgi:hypothetical protein